MRTCINKHVGQTAESKPDLTILRALYSHVGHWLSASFSSSCGLLDGLVVMKLRKTLVTPRKIVKSNHQITAFFILFPTKISPHGVLSLGSQHLHRTILESLWRDWALECNFKRVSIGNPIKAMQSDFHLSKGRKCVKQVGDYKSNCPWQYRKIQSNGAMPQWKNFLLLYALASKRNQNRPCECVDLINVETVLQRAEYLEVPASLWILIKCLSILSILIHFLQICLFHFSHPPVFHILHRRLDCSWYKIQFTMACNPKYQNSSVLRLCAPNPRQPQETLYSLYQPVSEVSPSRSLQVHANGSADTLKHFTHLHTSSHNFQRKIKDSCAMR